MPRDARSGTGAPGGPRSPGHRLVCGETAPDCGGRGCPLPQGVRVAAPCLHSPRGLLSVPGPFPFLFLGADACVVQGSRSHRRKKWSLDTDYFQTISAYPVTLTGTYGVARSGVELFFLEREKRNGDGGARSPVSPAVVSECGLPSRWKPQLSGRSGHGRERRGHSGRKTVRREDGRVLTCSVALRGSAVFVGSGSGAIPSRGLWGTCFPESAVCRLKIITEPASPPWGSHPAGVQR